MARSTLRRAAAPLLLLAFGLALCAGGDAGHGALTAAPADAAAVQAAYLACLHRHGLVLTPDGTQVDKDVNSPAVESVALAACTGIVPVQPPDPDAVAKGQKVTDCMHAAGYPDIPGPDTNGETGFRGRQGVELKSNQREFATYVRCYVAAHRKRAAGDGG